MGRIFHDSLGGGTAASKTTGDLFATFGEFLRYLRRGERLTQTDLGIAVGYSTQHIHLLESGRRLPDPTTIAALFVPALRLESRHDAATRLVELAAASRAHTRPAPVQHGHGAVDVGLRREVTRIETVEEVGTLEDPPPAPLLAVARQGALARLRERLASERCLALCGLPGMGKTTLAATLAREHAATGPVLWITLTDGINASVDALVRQLALFAIANDLALTNLVSQLVGRAPGSPALPLDQQIVLLTGSLSGKATASALLCFDNSHLIPPGSAVSGLLERLIATSAASFLFVSRDDVPLPGLAHIQLDGLETDEADRLMQRLLSSSGPANQANAQTWPDGEMLDRLYQWTAGSPMLLRLSIGEMLDRRLDLSTFVEQLATQPQISSYLLDTIINRLTPAARRVASLAALVRQPINLYDPALTELMRRSRLLDREQAAGGLSSALAELQHRHVLDNPGRATLHPLVSSHLARTLASDPEEWRALHLLAARYSDRRLGNVVEAAYHYCQAAKLNEMADVLADQGLTLFNQGAGQAALEVVEEGLAQARRKRNPPVGLLRRLLAIRGDLLASGLRAGEAEANYREALALSLSDGSPAPVRAQIMSRLAACLTQRSQAPEALDICRRAIDMLSPGDTLLDAQLVMVESGALAILGRLDEAESSGVRALDLSDGLMTTLPGVALGIRARSHNVLGMVSAIRQQHDDALRHWSSAVDAARQIDMVQLEYRCRGNMGNVFYEKGDLERATRYCAEAVTALQAMGDEYGAVRFMNTLANAQYIRLELDDAIRTLRQACAIKQRMGDRSGLAISLAGQAMALLAQGHPAQARSYVDDALRELQDTEALRVHGYVLMTKCDTQVATGDASGAHDTLLLAEDLTEAQADIKWSGDLQNHRALVLFAAGEIDAARLAAAEEPPPAAGIEIGMTRRLINGAIALSGGDREKAATLFNLVKTQASDAGFHLFQAAAERLQKATQGSPAPAELARLFFC